MSKINVSQISVEIIDVQAPDPPGRKEFAAELERLEWLANHPNAPGILPYIAATVHNALIWAASGRAEPASEVLQKFLVQEGLAGNDDYVPRYCLSCGCTEDYACPGGCGWSNAPGICTACATKGGTWGNL